MVDETLSSTGIDFQLRPGETFPDRHIRVRQYSDEKTKLLTEWLNEHRPLQYPADFNERVLKMAGAERNGETICYWTAMYLLGMVDSPTIRRIDEIEVPSARYLPPYFWYPPNGRNFGEVADSQMYRDTKDLGNIPPSLTELFRTCPLLLLFDKGRRSTHWMVTDPNAPGWVFQTDNHTRPFRHASICEIIATGNYQNLSTLALHQNDWFFEFVK